MRKPKLLQNKILIVGCGRLGSTIANKFASEGKNVMVIDSSEKEFELLDEKFSGYTFVGDATDLSILEEAYISSAREIIISTGNDNTNIFVAHIARKIYDVPEIYVRLDNPENEILIKGMHIKAIYPFELSFDKFNLLRGGH